MPHDAVLATIDKAVEQGYTQIEMYTSDKGIMEMLTLGNSFKAGVLVFVGLKKVLFRPWPKPAPVAKPVAKKNAVAKSTKTTKTDSILLRCYLRNRKRMKMDYSSKKDFLVVVVADVAVAVHEFVVDCYNRPFRVHKRE